MDVTRRRKIVNQDNNLHKNGTNKRRRKSKTTHIPSIKVQLICLILCVGILTLFISLYMDTVFYNAADKVALGLGYRDPLYAVIIDAGSTGSRVLAFTFHKTYLGNRLILDKELFVQIKPGLSSFVNDPSKGVASISELLERAKAEIPEQYWANTPLVLKATAGLRLLPEKKANALIEAVEEFFKKTPFLTNSASVGIMDGVDEGIFSWVTVNFLKGVLNSGAKGTVAALDLGGGSTQLTFAPTFDSTLSQKEFIHVVPTDNNNVKVYTHSYLGLGLMAARKEILSVGNEHKSLTLTSECINPVINSTSWHYGGKEYLVSGSTENIPSVPRSHPGDKYHYEAPKVNFDQCLTIIQQYVRKMVVVPDELVTKRINAFSYYFDRAAEFGLIDPFDGGVVTVDKFLDAAQEAAKQPNVEQPFMCLDLTFIYVLLKDGFGLKSTTELNLYKKIAGHELSWALGAALNILQN